LPLGGGFDRMQVVQFFFALASYVLPDLGKREPFVEIGGKSEALVEARGLIKILTKSEV